MEEQIIGFLREADAGLSAQNNTQTLLLSGKKRLAVGVVGTFLRQANGTLKHLPNLPPWQVKSQ